MPLVHVRKSRLPRGGQFPAFGILAVLAMMLGGCALEPLGRPPPSAGIDVTLTPVDSFDLWRSDLAAGGEQRQAGYVTAVAASAGRLFVVDRSVPGVLTIDPVSRQARLLLELVDGDTRGLHVTEDLLIYVVDRYNRAVLELGDSGWQRRVYEDEHRIPAPVDVTETNWGATVLVADELTRRLVMFDNLSNPIGMLAPTLSPVALAASIDALSATESFVFVLDSASREVTQVDLNGMPVGTYGEDALLVPVAIAVDECLRLFVADGHAEGLFVSSPENLGSGTRARLPGEISSSVTDLWIDGNSLYVAAGPLGVHVLDIDPPCLGAL